MLTRTLISYERSQVTRHGTEISPLQSSNVLKPEKWMESSNISKSGDSMAIYEILPKFHETFCQIRAIDTRRNTTVKKCDEVRILVLQILTSS